MPVHVMMDLETLGTMPGCVVLSIGACTFEPLGTELSLAGETFTANIDRKSCEDLGLGVDPLTINWWERQDASARYRLETGTLPLPEVADLFHTWFKGFDAARALLWCNGACFDEPIWRMAVHAAGLKVPWKYWHVRDTRTAWDLGGINPKNVPRDGDAHDALADARHQARCVQLAYARLRGPTLFADPGPEAA